MSPARSATAAPAPDDVLIERQPEHPLVWRRTLVWFVRILALVWIVKGLFAWCAILGIGGGPGVFEDRSHGYQAAMIYFAVVDLAAAVGLWLAATWGGVLWLLAVMSHLILAVFFPRFVANGALLIALLISCMMIYLVISWFASVEE